MSAAWTCVLVVGVATIAFKAVGPVALGGRELPPAFDRVIALMAPPLIAALIATQALADGDKLAVGPDTAGVAAAAIVMWRTSSGVATVVVAAVVTALLRAAGL